MRRSLYQTGNDCRLGQAEVGGRMREELATGGIHAVSAPSKINLVQIKLKDLLLGEFAFQGQRQNHFPELAGAAVAVVEKYVAGDLLRHCGGRSEEHTSELQSLMRISYAVFCLKQNNIY